MPRERIVDLVDLEIERIECWRKYYENPKHYASKIKNIAKKLDPYARVLLFGSVVKGDIRPDSDIDVLVVTGLAKSVDDRIRLRIMIAKEIGEYTPFEIHIVTPEEYEKWYKKFINKFIEV